MAASFVPTLVCMIIMSRRVNPVRRYARPGSASAPLEAHLHVTDAGFVVLENVAVVVDAHLHDEQVPLQAPRSREIGVAAAVCDTYLHGHIDAASIVRQMEP